MNMNQRSQKSLCMTTLLPPALITEVGSRYVELYKLSCMGDGVRRVCDVWTSRTPCYVTYMIGCNASLVL